MNTTTPDVEVVITSEGMVKLTRHIEHGVQSCFVIHPDHLQQIFERLGYRELSSKDRPKRNARQIRKLVQVETGSKGCLASTRSDTQYGDRPHFELTLSE